MNKRMVTAKTVAAIVLCGDDAEALGSTAAELRERGLRVAVCIGRPEADDVVELANELFPPPSDADVR